MDGADAPARTAPRLVLVLGMLTAFAPLSTTMYVPAMPAMADDLGASASAVQLTVSGLTIGLAVGQLVAGPLSDRLGRRLPLLVGLAAYVGASLLCAWAPSTGVLVGARVLQGVAGAAGIVLGRAIVRDLHSGVAAARLFATLVLITGVTPVVAPLLGGQALLLGDWRTVFVVQAVVGTVVAVAAWRIVPETLPAHRRRPGSTLAVTRRALGLLGDRVILGCALTCGLVYAAMLTAISGAGFVFQEVYGASEQATAVLFATAAGGIVVASRAGSARVGRLGTRRLLDTGIATSVAAGVLAVLAWATGLGLVLLAPALFLGFTSHGLTLPNATAIALSDHPHVAGSASAALGTVQYALGAGAAPLAGVGGQHTAAPMVIAILLLALAAAAASRLVPAAR
ncbi:MAG TPA: multidrug effflux MFS transporter [Baekduia sp.]|nr:multidrug effflux MFS transporter [Baekduia sp.]